MAKLKNPLLVSSRLIRPGSNHLAQRRQRRGCFEQLEARLLLATNQPPVNDVPGLQETQVNTPLAFTDFRVNRLSVSDPDVGGNKLLVTLTATHGSLSLIYFDPNGGLTYSVGDGTDDVTMTFTGTVADVNAAFEWVVFMPDTDYVGVDAGINLITNDQGFVGTGGPKEDEDFIPITVSDVPAFDPSPTFETLPAALDSSFDGDGKQILSLSPGVDIINQMLPMAGGKILAVGAVNNHFGLMRFNQDLTLDPTFGTGGVVESDFGAGKHALTAIQHPDGSLLVGGNDYLAKYSSEGVLDGTFGVGGKTLSSHVNPVEAIGVQADGKIVVTGPNGQIAASRYLSTGNLDTSYGSPTWSIVWSSGVSNGLHLRDSGQMVLTGETLFNNNIGYFGAARINTFGALENSSSWSTGERPYSKSSYTLPDGKILQVGDSGGDIFLIRYNVDASVDSTFGTGGVTALPVLNGEDRGQRVSLQADGKILIAGSAFNGVSWEAAVIRLTYDGAIDETFIAGGSSAVAIDVGPEDDFGHDILSLLNGKILVAGRAGDDIALVRLLGDSDIISPTATLASPSDGSSIDVGVLNTQGYLEVTFADEGDSGLDLDTVTDVENELMLSGSAAAGVTLDGAATLVSGTTYQYAFTGTFSDGPVSVEFIAGTFADQLGNTSESAMESFTVTSPNGNFDGNSSVDGIDFLAWQRGFGLVTPNAAHTDGDADFDQDVDGDDFDVWEGQFGSLVPLPTIELARVEVNFSEQPLASATVSQENTHINSRDLPVPLIVSLFQKKNDSNEPAGILLENLAVSLPVEHRNDSLYQALGQQLPLLIRDESSIADRDSLDFDDNNYSATDEAFDLFSEENVFADLLPHM